MSEPLTAPQAFAASSSFYPSETHAQYTAGEILRDARQAQGLDIASLAGLLKVPVQKLEALEHDQFEQLLDPVFARALASSVCRILKLDPAPVLQRLPAISAFKVTSQNRGINASFRDREGGQGTSVWSHISRPAILIVLALLLGALVIIFLPAIQSELSTLRQDSSASSTTGQLVEHVSTSTPAMTQGVNSGAMVETVQALPVQPVPVASVTPTVAPLAAPAAPVPVLSASAPDAASTIVFTAKADSWVKVTDAKGGVVLSRLLKAGETSGASGTVPLSVVVGRADAIEVLVRGQAFGLGNVSKSNVARFEVK